MGYQLRNDAVLYLMNNELLPRQEAEDHMICQKVLTRIQGTQKTIETVLCKLAQVCQDVYPLAFAAVNQMLEGCRLTNYASFWDERR